MTTQPDETTATRPLVVERRHGGNGYDVLAVDGRSFCLADLSPIHARQMATSPAPGEYDLLTPGVRAKWAAVADYLEAAEQRADRAAGAFPDDTPPPRRPRVQLRQQVDVNGLEVADLVVRVHPSTTDAEGALADAQRALHDAVLAITRVPAVKPADHRQEA